MIIIRAPLRISFTGGGTDLPSFYRKNPGMVLSTTINKYVYVAINETPLSKNITARYSSFETVTHPKHLNNHRIRAVLSKFNITKNIDVTTFSDVPIGTGLGSSSSFVVALLKGFYLYQNQSVSNEKIAEDACRLELQTLKEPIGKQDQYAAAIGGFNIFKFNTSGFVETTPLYLEYKKKVDFNNHLLLFFTGITREASSVLFEQNARAKQNMALLKDMSYDTLMFKNYLLNGKYKKLGQLIHVNWLRKKKLTSKISNKILDELYSSGYKNGAWGGKILGAGGGGCILFITASKNKNTIRKAVAACAKNNHLSEFKEIEFTFGQSGVEILMHQI